MPRPARAPAAQPRIDRRRRRNREALLEAAIDLFQERGIRGTKLEDICERAHVSARTFFNHFETREHLYRALSQQRARQLAALFDTSAGEPGSLAESLPRIFARIAAYLDARPLYRELVGEMLHARPGGASELVRTRALGSALRRFVEHGLAATGARCAVAPEVLADVVLGALTTALANWSATDSYDLPYELQRSAAALQLLFAAAEQTPAARRSR
jgi:AcrR family transcriptional regulator